MLSWQAFVTLLLGHIELHGRQRPDQAAEYYQLTLDCQPQDTLVDLAKQGLQRSKSTRKETFNANVDELKTLPPSDGESSTGSLPWMLQDPFLATLSLHQRVPHANPRPCHGSKKSTLLHKPGRHQHVSQNKMIHLFVRTQTLQNR